MESGWGKEFFSQASLSVSIQIGQFGPVAYRRTLNSEAASPNRLEALNECFRSFSKPGVNCWVTTETPDLVMRAPSPGTKLPVVVDPTLPDDLRNYLEGLVRNQNVWLKTISS